MKKIRFASVLRELVGIRLRLFKGGFIAWVLLKIASGIVWGMGISALQLLFDAVEDVIRTPSLGFDHILPAVGMVVGLIIGERISSGVIQYMNNIQALAMQRELSDRLNKKAARLDPALYEDTDQLEKIEKAGAGISSGIRLATTLLDLLFYYLPAFGYICWYIFSLRPLLLLVFMLIMVPTAIKHMIRTRILAQLEDQSSPYRRAYNSYEATLGDRAYVKETRQLGAFSFLFSKYRNVLKDFNRTVWKHRGRIAKVQLYMQGFSVASYIGIFVLLALSLRDGIISIGAFAAVFASIEQLFDQMSHMIDDGFFGGLADHYPAARNYIAFMRLPERGGRDEEISEHTIVFDDVTFYYPGRNEPAIDHVSFTLNANETIALVGDNGAGKSTLVKLLTGVYLPTSGRITIDGHDTPELSTKALFKDVSGVMQSYQRYQLTAMDNIAISEMEKPQDSQALNEAAQRADVDFASGSFPNGAQTMLSREFGGVDLSGGQWQRVAIARGLYRTHTMMVMDEPTAAIDPLEEAALYQQFIEMAKDKTAVLVTHRLGSAKIADRIFVMRNGKMIECGTHEELIAKSGEYSVMFSSQAQWYRNDNTPYTTQA